MKRYEKYKDSGVDWIGEIPEGWEVKRVSYFFEIQLGKMLQPNKLNESDTLGSYLCAANLGKNALNLSEVKQMWFSEEEKKIYSVQKGDLLVVEGGDVASNAIIEEDLGNMYIQNALHRVRPKAGQDVRYLHYWLIMTKYRGYIDQICNKATIAHFTKEKFKTLQYPNVPLSEQQSIASYLDMKVKRIDAVIKEKQKMIADLQKYRMSVISEAVTHGLNPDVRMKDSGVEWIGEIPEGWKTLPLKYSGNFDNGLTYSPNDITEDGIIVLRSSNIQKGKIDYEDIVKVKSCPEKLLVNKGDIIICSRNGSASLIGKCAVYTDDKPVTFGAFMMRYRPEINSTYAFYVFQTAIKKYKSLFTTSTINQLTREVIKQIYIPLAPNNEQMKIASYLDEKTGKVDSLIAALESQIEELKSYKCSLISEAVTGKVDLRGWKEAEQKN